jgi:hypothetical protein
MSQEDLLRHLVESMEGAGIGYMITGSVASSLQGEPRASHDLDVVVAVREEDVASLLRAFPHPPFYVDEAAIREAIRTGGMFNVIDPTEGDKIDFWMLTDEEFDASRFARRVRQSFLGLELSVSSPEDTILAKLRWSKLAGGARKTFEDALRVYEVQYERLDRSYLAEWAARLGVVDEWQRLEEEAQPL